jgi:transcriptional regulator
MYIPKHFEITETSEIYSFILNNAFGQIISNLNGKLFSTHIPFLLSDDRKKILGHVAKQNPQIQNLDGQEVLITLEGPHDYISPTWYEGSGVPTWNYQAVHIYGICTVFNNQERLAQVVNTLTEKYESKFEEPWKPDYKATMLGAIVGIEVSINEIQCTYKLSQNRSEQDQKNVVFQLKSQGSSLLAEAMERTNNKK